MSQCSGSNPRVCARFYIAYSDVVRFYFILDLRILSFETFTPNFFLLNFINPKALSIKFPTNYANRAISWKPSRATERERRCLSTSVASNVSARAQYDGISRKFLSPAVHFVFCHSFGPASGSLIRH